jgi:hypothetical protein
MGKIVELYPEPEMDAVGDAAHAKRGEESLEAFVRLQDAIEGLRASSASEPIHDLACACYGFVRSLLAAAPEDVIRDLAYVIVLYLKKQAISEELKT